MQPLNATVRPTYGSTSGCEPCSDRSMIFRRRCARATGPADQEPPPSGPRAAIVAAIASTAATSARSPGRCSPANPHISGSYPRSRRLSRTLGGTMAQTRKRRRSKHRGNAAGIIEARGRTGRKLTADERKPTAKEARAQRWGPPPAWPSAATPAALAVFRFGPHDVAIMGRSIAKAVVIAAAMLVLYIPLGY